MIFFHYHWDNILTQALNQKLPVCRCHIFFNKLIDLSVPKKYCIVGFVYLSSHSDTILINREADLLGQPRKKPNI